jgi:hypothetical protein
VERCELGGDREKPGCREVVPPQQTAAAQITRKQNGPPGCLESLQTGRAIYLVILYLVSC